MQLRLKIGVLIFAFLLFIVGKAQNTFPSGGNVGIGTINPSAPLHIIGGAGNTIQLQKTTNNLPAILFSGANYSSIIEAGDNFNLYTNGVSRFYVTSSGNVGIGTTSPTQYISGAERVLQIYNPNAASLNLQDNNSTWTLTNAAGLGFYNNGYKMFVSNSGNVGIGTTSPLCKLDISGSDPVIGLTSSGTTNSYGAIRGNNGTWLFGYGGSAEQEDISVGTQDGTGSRTLTLASGGYPRVRVASNGNVLIGKTTQSNTSYKLDVAGNIRANKLVVNTTGADYVFANRYKLRPLAQVENYIKQNRHLPGIKPAKQMQEEGISVGETQTRLLEKIEELTLYVIDQNKKLIDQNKKLEELNKTNKQLMQKNNALTQRITTLEQKTK